MQGKQRLLVDLTAATMGPTKTRPGFAWDRWLRSQGRDPLVVRALVRARRESNWQEQPCELGPAVKDAAGPVARNVALPRPVRALMLGVQTWASRP